MSDPLSFFLQVFLLLVVPGPTNTLLCLSGKDRGVVRSIRLMAGEAGGYLLVIVPVFVYLGPLIAAHPMAVAWLKAAAAAWVLYLAVSLWRTSTADSPNAGVTVARVFLTTTLNPKALVFALVLFRPDDALAGQVAVFLAALFPVALLWMTVGAAAGRALGSRGGALRKVASGGLLVFSAVLARAAAFG